MCPTIHPYLKRGPCGHRDRGVHCTLHQNKRSLAHASVQRPAPGAGAAPQSPHKTLQHQVVRDKPDVDEAVPAYAAGPGKGENREQAAVGGRCKYGIGVPEAAVSFLPL